MSFKQITLIAATVMSLGAVANASAGPAWDFTTAGNSFTNGSWDFGNKFRVNSDVTVTGLGYYADPSNGFVDANQVALYDSLGNLLASATVNNTYPLFGHFRFVTVGPVTLHAGQTYQVDGVSHSDNYTWNDAGFATDPSITYLGNTWQSGSTPDFMPDTKNDVTDGIWGANVFFGTATFTGQIPEPGSLALLGLSLVGLLGCRRKAKQA